MQFQNIKRLFAVLGPYKGQYALAGFLLVASIFVRMLEPKLIQMVIDYVVTPLSPKEATVDVEATAAAAEQTVSEMPAYLSWLPEVTMENLATLLLIFAGLYLGISIIRGVFMLIASALSASSTERAIKSLRDRMFAHIQALPMEYHTSAQTGQLVQRSTGDIDTIKRFILNQVVEVIRLTAIFVFAFIMIAIVNLKFALISIATVPILVIAAVFFFRREGKVWEAHEDESDKLNSLTQENLDGIRVVQAFANEEHEIKRFDKQNKRTRKWDVKHTYLHAIYWPSSDLLVLAQIFVSLFVGAYLTINGTISIGDMVSCYIYSGMVAWPLRHVGRVITEMGMAVVAMGRMHDILTEEVEDYSGLIQKGELVGEVEFNNVSFGYDKEKEPVLKDVSFTIQPGEKLAIIGPAGSGKSTIIKLLTRFYEPAKGNITLDGEPLTDYAKHYLRNEIGVVLQKPFLFSTTVRENIAYTNPELPEDEITAAATIAQIEHIKDVLPNGYQTLVGEKGVTLSGGQKQRVSLARTLISKPDILVLDDVTSAVDTHTEQAIFEALEENTERKTTIIISHRLTSIQQADRILVLDQGRVVDEGTHEELISREGYYRDIHLLQSELEEEIRQEVA